MRKMTSDERRKIIEKTMIMMCENSKDMINKYLMEIGILDGEGSPDIFMSACKNLLANMYLATSRCHQKDDDYNEHESRKLFYEDVNEFCGVLKDIFEEQLLEGNNDG